MGGLKLGGRRAARLIAVVMAVALASALVPAVAEDDLAHASGAAASGWQGSITIALDETYDNGGTYSLDVGVSLVPALTQATQSWPERFPWDPDLSSQPAARSWDQGFVVNSYSGSSSAPGGPIGPNTCMWSSTESWSAPGGDVVATPTSGDSLGTVWIGDEPGTPTVGPELNFDFAIPVANVTSTSTTSGAICGNPGGETTTSVGSVLHPFTLRTGIHFGVSMFESVPVTWPGTPPVTHLAGSHTVSGINLGTGGGTQTQTITWDLDLVPVAPDGDLDGTPDADDQCPTEPGPATNGGCPAETVDCDGPTDTRGFVAAEVKAEIDTAVGDPDLFSFSPAASWCATDGVIEVDQPLLDGAVTMNTALATTFDLLGFTFAYDPEVASIIGTETGSTATVTANGQFEGCFDWTAFIAAAGGKLLKTLVKAIGNKAAAAYGVASRTAPGRAIDDAIAAAANALGTRADSFTTKVANAVNRWLKTVPKSLRTMLADGIRTTVAATLDVLERALESVVRAAISSATGQTSVRLTKQAITANVQTEATRELLEGFDLSSCFELWQPEVTLTIPLSGASSITTSGFTNPFLLVTPAIVEDIR